MHTDASGPLRWASARLHGCQVGGCSRKAESLEARPSGPYQTLTWRDVSGPPESLTDRPVSISSGRHWATAYLKEIPGKVAGTEVPVRDLTLQWTAVVFLGGLHSVHSEKLSR